MGRNYPYDKKPPRRHSPAGAWGAGQIDPHLGAYQTDTRQE